MKLTRSVQINPALFAVIPLVNVLFLLLVFHTLSSNFVLQPGISITLPFSTFTLGPQRNTRIVTVTSAPAPSIYYRDEKFTFDGFAKKLSQDRGRDRTLIIKADRDAPYSLVVKIMSQGLQSGYSVVLATSGESK
jgi:biopolymer transport protein ExbD